MLAVSLAEQRYDETAAGEIIVGTAVRLHLPLDNLLWAAAAAIGDLPQPVETTPEEDARYEHIYKVMEFEHRTPEQELESMLLARVWLEWLAQRF